MNPSGQDIDSQIECYLSMFLQGETDNAFHGLLESNHETIPKLIDIFRGERDFEVREFLVKVIWQYRDHSVIPYLGEALLDPEPSVWRQALDGLVALASQASLCVLQEARMHPHKTQKETEDFRIWLEEAIEQVEAEMYSV